VASLDGSLSTLAMKLLCIALSSVTVSSQQPFPLSVDFPSFLARADPVYLWNSNSSGPTEWVDALFGGNGELGYLLWQSNISTLQIDVSRTPVYDDRNASLGAPRFLNNFVFDKPRLPIGHFSITFLGEPILSGDGRISLFSAVSSLNITTAAGNLSLAVWACAAWDTAADVITVEASWSGASAPTITWVPEIAQSTWSGRNAEYVPNPPPTNASSVLRPGSVLNVTTQPHLAGTAHATAVLRADSSGGDSAVLYVAISCVVASSDAASAEATSSVTAAAALGVSMLRAAHANWWANWWPAGGFLTLEDSIIESFVFVQLYKFASGARRGRSVHDLEGPWFIQGTDWPDLHWDLNLQYPYYMPLLFNRPDVTSTFIDFFSGLLTSGALIANVPTEWQHDSAAAPTGASSLHAEMSCYWNYGANCTTSPPSVTGNLLWCLHVLHLAADVSGNSTIDTAVVWPLLGRALQFHTHFASADASGTIHLAETYSPEWPGGPGRDANYDVSLFRWGLALAAELAARYSLESPYLSSWADTLNNMTFFPIDGPTQTLSIYAGVPYDQPHRHFSHLFSIWPLHLLDVSNATLYNVARNSINLWLATPEEDSMFYRPAASAMNVVLGQSAAAFDNITFLLRERIEGSTFYREGSQGSCTETPYAAAWAVGDWLLQSWNKTALSTPPGLRIIHFFPGIDDVITLSSPYNAAPSRVATASFWRLAAFNGAVVSGSRALVRSNSTHVVTRTAWVGVEVQTGGSFVVRTNLLRPLAAYPTGTNFVELGGGEGLVQVTLPAGGIVALYSAAMPPPNFQIVAAAGCPAEFNHWGVSPARSGGLQGTPVVLRNCSFDVDGRATPTQRYTWNAEAGLFALQDGSDRCLSVATCTGENGALVQLTPCSAASGGGGGPSPIGCETVGCAAEAQTWTMTGSTGTPPNAIKTNTSGRCIDVNGAFNPDTIDVWDCSSVPGADKNEEFVWNETTGAIVSLDTNPCCLNMCLTPKS
jgi:hypothetical protein